MEIKRILTYSFFKGCSIIFLNWSIADLQCLLISAIQQVTQLYTYVLFFLYYFPLLIILEIGYSSLCHTVGLCCLSILLFSSISLHWSLKNLCLQFLGTLHSDAYIFPFLLYFLLPFFSQLFVRFPQTSILLFCISFSCGRSWFLFPVQCHKSPSIVHKALYQI